jgi:hypothetical protein
MSRARKEETVGIRTSGGDAFRRGDGGRSSAARTRRPGVVSRA